MLRQPSGAKVVSNTTVATTTVSLALAATTNVTNFVQGFTVTSDLHSAAAGAAITVTLTGLAGSTLGMNWVVKLSSTEPINLSQEFVSPLPASAAETAITLAVPGTTSTGNIAANIWGYQMKTF